jgi:hypothetical protein
MFYDTLNGWMADWATDEPPWFGAGLFGFASGQVPTNAASPLMAHPYENACPNGPDILGNCIAPVGLTDPFPSKLPPSNLDFGNAGLLPFGPSDNWVNPHLKTPYIYQYNLSVERQLANGLMAEIGYAGSSSHKLLTWLDENPYILGTNQRVLNAQPGVLPGTYGYATTFDGLNNANYNGLLASLTERERDIRHFGGIFFTLAYTWSHNLDNGSGFNSRSQQIAFYNRRQFYGNSDFDIRQRLTFSGGWNLPFAQLWSSGPKRLTAGWSLYPIVFAQTGIPLDVTAGLIEQSSSPGPSGAGDQQVVRADKVTSSVQTLNPRQSQTINGTTANYWFNPNDFALDPCIPTQANPNPTPCPLGFYGTYKRNSFRGPGRINADLALEKTTNLVSEQVKLVFRVEAFNIFNHAEFRAPSPPASASATSVSSGTLGQISRTFDPRILQLALRFVF